MRRAGAAGAAGTPRRNRKGDPAKVGGGPSSCGNVDANDDYAPDSGGEPATGNEERTAGRQSAT